jgi:uncharacterized protein YecE (DUF72 family)
MNTLQPFKLDPLGSRLQALARKGIYVGTSSWKYPGWLGDVYTNDRYIWRGRFSKARFERNCLAEYAETFRTVCVDAAYYTFPNARGLRELAGMVPDDFRFAFKVTDEITIKRFPVLPRFGPRAGRQNPNFLRAGLFSDAFLEPCLVLGQKLGPLVFEFSHFASGELASPGLFLEQLDDFLGRLPQGHRYGVEIRNEEFLVPEYFAILARHDVAHVYNSWQAMPSIGEQLERASTHPAASFVGARFLLRPGRAYADAVKRFSPYDQLKEPYPEGVAAGARLIRAARHSKGSAPAFLYVNNRFEGNAPQTIRRMLDAAET